jgi:glutamate carboxypeptidase
MPSHALLDHLRPRTDAMLAELRGWVEHETPSRDEPALDRLAAKLAARFGAIGGAVETIANDAGGNHVKARFGFGFDDSIAPALVLCHFDTVWPVGTLARRPFRVEDGRAYGPGAFDMKASLVLVAAAIEAIRALRLAPPRPLVVLFTSDEEVGSPTSRGLIEAEARGAAFALVMEAPLPGGRLKTARKGVGGFTLTVSGRAAHAGVEPEKGASAIVELAHQVLAIGGLADRDAGTTLNVGTIAGGTTPNVVPDRATAAIDVRVSKLEEADRVEAALRALRPVTPGTSLAVAGKFNRPPMERTAAIGALFERARAVGRTLGMDLHEGATGGGSDGNFTAAVGTPTLDGLGAGGAGAHAEDEHVRVDSLPERAALLAALLAGL